MLLINLCNIFILIYVINIYFINDINIYFINDININFINDII